LRTWRSGYCCALYQGIEPTNNRAERDLRPAVIARKVSHCAKNERGARAFVAFISVLNTFRKLNSASIIPALSACTFMNDACH
jgi:hypothetical protein